MKYILLDECSLRESMNQPAVCTFTERYIHVNTETLCVIVIITDLGYVYFQLCS